MSFFLRHEFPVSLLPLVHLCSAVRPDVRIVRADMAGAKVHVALAARHAIL